MEHKDVMGDMAFDHFVSLITEMRVDFAISRFQLKTRTIRMTDLNYKK